MTRTKTRAQANWPNNAVSVLDYGAVGDGVTDDTAAIQAAIDSGVGFVSFPHGTYKVTSTLNLVSNQTLSGPAIIDDQSPTTLISGLGVSYSRIENIEFINQNNTTFQILYDANDLNCFGPELVNLKFKNGVGQGSIRIASSDWVDADWVGYAEPDPATWNRWNNPIIENVTIQDYQNINDGSSSISVTGFSGGTISNIKLEGIQERGISLAFFLNCQVDNISVQTSSNGIAGTNPHGMYIRTFKRLTLNNLCVDYGDNPVNAWGLRLSRGAYYGSFSNIVVKGTATTAGGIGFLGGERNTFIGGSLSTPVNTLHIAGHGSATVGTGDSSFAHCKYNVFSGFSLKSTDGPAVKTWAAGVPVNDLECDMHDVIISDCSISSDSAVDSVVLFMNGYNCQFINNTINDSVSTTSSVVLTKDNRIAADKYSWTISGNTFIIEGSTRYGIIADPQAGVASYLYPTGHFSFTNNVFLGGSIAFSNRVGFEFSFSNNECRGTGGVDIRTIDIVDVSTRTKSVVVTNNVFSPGTSTAALSCYVSIDYLDFSYNLVANGGSAAGGYAIRNGVGTATANQFNISHNTVYVNNIAFRDLYDDARVKLSFNDINEGTVSTIGASVDQQYNILRTF